MNLRSALAFVFGLVAVFSVAENQERFLLRLNIDEGQVYNYRTYSEVRSSKGDYREESKNRLTVKSRTDEEYVLETFNHDISYQLSDGRQLAGIDSTILVTQTPDGSILGLKTDTGADDDKLSRNPNNFAYPPSPVTVGSTWEKFVPADAVLKTPGTTVSYTVSARKMWRGFDVYVIRYSNHQKGETPMPMSGTTYIEIGTGLSVFSEAYFENLTDPDLKVAGRFRMKYVRE